MAGKNKADSKTSGNNKGKGKAAVPKGSDDEERSSNNNYKKQLKPATSINVRHILVGPSTFPKP